LKFLAYLLVIITIGLGLWGLSPVEGGKIILPEQLLAEEWNQAEEEDYLKALIGQFKSELHHCPIHLYRIPHSGYDSQDIFEDDC
jgi:hypothetical protein